MRPDNTLTNRSAVAPAIAELAASRLRAAARLAVISIFFPLIALGQITQGSLSGLVKDPQGAAMPGAAVTIKNLQTNEQISAKTNESGLFELPSLQPGRYAVTAELRGFKRVEARPVIVETARPSHIEVKLEVSQLAEAVTIKGSDAQADVNVVNPEINTVLTTRQLLDLPMIRNPFIIVNSLPGINAPSASGLRGTSTNITQDGINVAAIRLSSAI